MSFSIYVCSIYVNPSRLSSPPYCPTLCSFPLLNKQTNKNKEISINQTTNLQRQKALSHSKQTIHRDYNGNNMESFLVLGSCSYACGPPWNVVDIIA